MEKKYSSDFLLLKQLNVLKPVVKKIVPSTVIRRGNELRIKHIQRQMRADPKQPYERGVFPDGINLIGPIDAATGLGQSFRLMECVIRKMGIPYVIFPFIAAVYQKIDIHEYVSKISSDLPYSVNIWHVSPAEFKDMYTIMGRNAFDRHYNIAYWLWELENFPDEWVGYEQVLDEIWTPSDFIANALKKKLNRPVYTIPYWVTAETNLRKYNRKWFHLPNKQFLFLMMYDGNSVSERKNPDGAIKAFQMAFQPDRKDVGLVIKAGSLNKKDYQRLLDKTKGYHNIRIIQGALGKEEVNSLIACTDTLISLHRSEGFGLVLAEAMLNGIPVIATNWSANTEFMDNSSACMVSYKLVQLKRNIPPYKKGERWADPNLNEAVHYMRELFADSDYCKAKGKAASIIIKKNLGLDQASKKISKRLMMVFTSPNH